MEIGQVQSYSRNFDGTDPNPGIPVVSGQISGLGESEDEEENTGLMTNNNPDKITACEGESKAPSASLTLREICEILDAEVLVGEDELDLEIKGAFAADLMSDVLAYAKSGCLLITGLTNPQIFRTADVLDIAAVIVGRGKRPSPEALELAKELSIPLLTTRYILFEIAGRLFARGIRGCIEKTD